MEFIVKALEALPHIASSPYAFVGYVFVIVAWLIIMFRVTRNKQLLDSLDKLPEAARLEALRMEMGAVKLKSGLTPDQWIKSRIHFYYFLAFVVFAVVIVIMFVISFTTLNSGTAKSDITLFTDNIEKKDNHGSPLTIPAEIEILNQYDGSGVRGTLYYEEKVTPKLKTLTYVYERLGNKIAVTPEMPYLTLLKEGGIISDSMAGYEPFNWQFPKLSVKVVNNTKNTLFLTELAIKVTNSTINLEPILLVYETANDGFSFSNEGWGTVNDPRLTFGLTNIDDCDKINVDEAQMPYEARLPAFKEDLFFQISPKPVSTKIIKKILSKKQSERGICGYGRLYFKTDTGQERMVKFRSRIFLDGVGAAEGPIYYYNLFLKAGKKGYTVYKTVSHSIKPGEVEHFVVRIGTDKSAKFDLSFSLRDASGLSIPSNDLTLDIFVPQSSVKQGYLSKQKTKWRVSTERSL